MQRERYTGAMQSFDEKGSGHIIWRLQHLKIVKRFLWTVWRFLASTKMILNRTVPIPRSAGPNERNHVVRHLVSGLQRGRFISVNGTFEF